MVSIVTYHGLGSLGIERQWRQDFCAIQNGSKAHTGTCSIGAGSFPCKKGQAHDTVHPSFPRARLQIGWSVPPASSMCLPRHVMGDLYLYYKLQLKGRQTQLINEVYKQLITLRATSFSYVYNHHQVHTKGHLAMPRCDYISIIH